jgi:hypothetical protein
MLVTPNQFTPPRIFGFVVSSLPSSQIRLSGSLAASATKWMTNRGKIMGVEGFLIIDTEGVGGGSVAGRRGSGVAASTRGRRRNSTTPTREEEGEGGSRTISLTRHACYTEPIYSTKDFWICCFFSPFVTDSVVR